jgi:phytoene dehydrogenase-like protein
VARLLGVRARTGRALVIGSGPNGLAAAITLAQAGAEVLVLEAAPTAGGAVATEELTLPGFRHDSYSSVYPAAAASPVFESMPLERYGLRCVLRAPAARRSRCGAVSRRRPDGAEPGCAGTWGR